MSTHGVKTRKEQLLRGGGGGGREREREREKFIDKQKDD